MSPPVGRDAYTGEGGGASVFPVESANGGSSSAPNANGDSATFELAASAFTSTLSPKLSAADVSKVFQQDFTHGLIKKVTNITPYESLPFSPENSIDVKNMLLGLTRADPASGLVIKKPELPTVWDIIRNRESTQAAGLKLAGIPVLKILEHMISNPELKSKIQVIFGYPKSATFLHLKKFILSMLRKGLFENFGKYLQVNEKETLAHLEAFVKAIGKQHLFNDFQSAVEKAEWEIFFDLVIKDDHIFHQDQAETVPYSNLPLDDSIIGGVTDLLSVIASSSEYTDEDYTSMFDITQALSGISVLKILEYIVSTEDLKKKIQKIFYYPKSDNLIISKISKELFGSFGHSLQINKEATLAHLEDFLKAIGKEEMVVKIPNEEADTTEEHKLSALCERAIKENKWREFFTFVIFDLSE